MSHRCAAEVIEEGEEITFWLLCVRGRFRKRLREQKRDRSIWHPAGHLESGDSVRRAPAR